VLNTLTPTNHISDPSDIDSSMDIDKETWRYHYNTDFYLKIDGGNVNNKDLEQTQKEVRLVLETLALQPQTRLLDVCGGYGRHSIALAQAGLRNLETFDYSEKFIQLGRQLVVQKRVTDRVKLTQGDARQLPHLDNSFDAVICMGNSLGMMPEDADDLQVLRQMFRVLRPGGKVLLQVSNSPVTKKVIVPNSWRWLDDEHVFGAKVGFQALHPSFAGYRFANCRI
jgi:D-alanine-D-alanine ligase